MKVYNVANKDETAFYSSGYASRYKAEELLRISKKHDPDAHVVEYEVKTRLEIMDEERAKLLARIPRWISVEERLPEDNRNVIVFVQHPISGHNWLQIAHIVSAIGMDECEDDEWWLDSTGETVSYITHWMLLPEPPKEDE